MIVLSPMNQENRTIPLPLDGLQLRRASGSERGGCGWPPTQAPPQLPARREGLMPRRESLWLGEG